MAIRGPTGGRRFSADLLAVFGLFAITAVVAWPALCGDLGPYLDNPIRLAEIRDLVRPDSTGWSDLAFLGFPIHMLHSPALYGALSALCRLGVPLGAAYTGFMVLGIVAPALSFYAVSRRRLEPLWAFAASSTLILYRGAVVGLGASLGGMFTFPMAAAVLILVIDRLTRPARSFRDVCILAALAGTVGLFHMYVTIALIYLAAIHTVFSLCRGPAARTRWMKDMGAFTLGGIAAAAYWLPNAISLPPPAPFIEPFSSIVARMFSAQLSHPGLAAGGSSTWFFDNGLDVPLQMGVALLALVGVKRMLTDEDDAPRYGAALTLLLLVLAWLDIKFRVGFLGRHGVRFVYLMRIGVLASALPVLSDLTRRVSKTRAARVVVVASAAIVALVLERRVADEAIPKDDPSISQAEALWSFLRESRTASWGRVFVQATLGSRNAALGKARASHLLVETAQRTGLEQAGVYYGLSPYRTETWLGADFDLVFGLRPGTDDIVDPVVARMQRSNCTHIVIVDPAFSERLARDGRFALLRRIGEFAVFELRGAVSNWARVTRGAGAVSVERLGPGRMNLTIDGAPERIVVAEAYHKFWRAVPGGFGEIRPDPDALLVIDRIRPGLSKLSLVYDPPSYPAWITFGALSVIAALFGLDLFRRRTLERNDPSARC